MGVVRRGVVVAAALAVSASLLGATAAVAAPQVPSTDETSLPQSGVTEFVVTYAATAATSAAQDEVAARAFDVEVSGGTPVAPNTEALRVEAPLTGAEAAQIAAQAEMDPGVVNVEPVARAFPASTDDPLFAQQWALSEFGAKGDLALARNIGINAEAAWSAASGTPPVVAVIDTGYTDHEDLQGRIVSGYDFISDPATDTDGVPGRDSDAHDTGDWMSREDMTRAPFSQWGTCVIERGLQAQPSSWHGTKVAGILGATVNNGVGIAGVVPNARIQPVRVLGKCGGSLADIAAAIRWAAGAPIPGVPANPTPSKVINLSLAAEGACPNFLQDAVNEATSRGAVVVAAVSDSFGSQYGDSSPLGSAPGNCANVVTVDGSSESGFGVSSFDDSSNWDIAAPGHNVLTTSAHGDTAPTQQMNYEPMSGPSAAAPHVAGVAALVLGRNPGLTPAQVTDTLKDTATATYLARPGTTQIGVLNAAAALGASTPPGPAVAAKAYMRLVADMEEYTVDFVPPKGPVTRYEAIFSDSGYVCSPYPNCETRVQTTRLPLAGPGATVLIKPRSIDGAQYAFRSLSVQAFNGTQGGVAEAVSWSAGEPRPPVPPQWGSTIPQGEIPDGLKREDFWDYKSGATSVKVRFLGPGYWFDQEGFVDSITATAMPGGRTCTVSRDDVGPLSSTVTPFGPGPRKPFQECVITGLEPGKKYDVTATSTDGTDVSAPSEVRTVVAGSKDPALRSAPDNPIPDFPTFKTYETLPGTGKSVVTLRWLPPSWEGSGPVTKYRVTTVESEGLPTAGGGAPVNEVTRCEGSILTCTFEVPTASDTTIWTLISACNLEGCSEGDVGSVDTTPGPAIPDKPTVTSSGGVATVTWPPATRGQFSIAGYVVTAEGSGNSCSVQTTWWGWWGQVPENYSCDIGGLTIGQSYRFKLTVYDSNYPRKSATSPLSDPVVIAGVPTVPSGLYPPSATAGPTSATVKLDSKFIARYDGGKPISKYVFTASPGGAVCEVKAPFGDVLTCTIGGLKAGTPYTFTTTAVNSVGTSAPSDPSTPVTPTAPVTVPGAPTGLAATAGDRQVSVAFVAPASNGGAAITNYQYSTDGAKTWVTRAPASTVSPLVITGLTNGTEYSIALRAVNSAGAGAASTVVKATPKAPVTVPGAPTGLAATAGDRQVSVAFVAPASNGGAAITNYQYSIDAGATWVARNPVSAASPLVITGLTNGTEYSIALRAVNSAGAGAASAIVKATPKAPVTVPGAPTGLVATAGDRQVSVAFVAPAVTGGAAVSNYQYSVDGGKTWVTRAPVSVASPVVITGLTNGTEYSIALRAVNSAGAGATSAVVKATPKAPVVAPGAPTGLVGTAGDRQVSVAFVAPASNGGAVVSNYQYSVDGGTTWVTRAPASVASPVVITGLTNGTEYSVALRAVNSAGAGAASTVVKATPKAPVVTKPPYTAMTPARFADSRPAFPPADGLGPREMVRAGQTVKVPIAGRFGLPTTGVGAVAVNITATGAEANTYLSVWPTGEARPTASNLNPAAGQTVPNMAIVKVGADGSISLYNDRGRTHVIVDVLGWFPTGADYTAISPARFADSRPAFPPADGLGPREMVGAGQTVKVPIAGRFGLPTTGVGAVAVNITATGAEANTFLSVWPTGEARPTASNLNPAAGQTVPNMAIVKVGADGSISLYNDRGRTHVIVDVLGWFPK